MIKKQIIKISFILLLAFVIVAPSGVCTALADDNGTSVSSSSWLMFRGNPARTGKTTLNGPPDEVEMKWRWRVSYDTDPVSASPVVTGDGTVYIGTEGGRLAAVKPGGGSGWVYNEVLGSFKASPAVDTSGNLLAVTEDGYMFYIDANGELLWKCDFNMDILSSPVTSGGLAYVGTNDGDVKGINLDPDDSLMSEDSKKIGLWYDIVDWSYPTLSFDNVKSSPAFSGETLFFGSGDYIYAVNPNSGDNATSALKWRYDVDSDVLSTPAVHNGVVYVTTSRGKLYAFKENAEGESTQGDVIWQRDGLGKNLTSPAVSDGDDGKTYIYFGSSNGNLYAYDDDGDRKWFFNTLGDIESSPAVDGNGDIYFGSNDKNIYALYPDGSLKWSFDTFSKVRSSPAIGPDNLLYVGCDNGYLYCLGENTDENKEPDVKVNVSLSPEVIENKDGSHVTISATIASGSEGEEVEKNKIASVEIDLSSLNVINFNGNVTVDEMRDDGANEDDKAGDGTYTYAFKLTDNPLEINDYTNGEGIYTHYLYLLTAGFAPEVGPFPIMVTAIDVYGNRVSQPVLINIKDKKPNCSPDYSGTVFNRLNNQDLTITLESTAVIKGIESIDPNSGAPGQIVTVSIVGLNTSFKSNMTEVEVINDNGTVLAFAYNDDDDVYVLSETQLIAQLRILNIEDVDDGTLTGKWNIRVTTGPEIVVEEDMFSITISPSRQVSEHDGLMSRAAASDCYFEISIFNENDVLLREPYRTNIINKGTVELEDVDAGTIKYEVTLNSECSMSPIPGFKLTTEASGFGHIEGEVINGFTGIGVDNATVSALIGLDIFTAGANTVSSGGGYYILPLAVNSEPYSVLAKKNLLTDLETDIIIKDGEGTDLNFSIKPDISCLISSLFGTSSLKTFYRFRDDVLMESRAGQRWTDMYYTHSWEVLALAVTDAEIMAKCIQTLFYAVVSIPEYMLTGRAGYMLCSTLNGLMDSLIELGSDGLKESLESERESILSFLGAGILQ